MDARELAEADAFDRLLDEAAPTLLDFLDTLRDDAVVDTQAEALPVYRKIIPREKEDKTDVTIKSQPKPKTKSNTWRQRQRQEVLKLQDEVKQLDAELKKMKLAVGVRSTVPLIEGVRSGGAAHTLRPAVRKLLGEKWQDAASRESLARQMADTENERLHRILHMQVLHARKLHRMMTQQMTTSVMAQALGCRPAFSGDEARPPTDNNEVFRRLLTRLDHLHGGLSSILVTEHSESESRKEGHISINRAQGLQVRIMASYAVPFSVQATEEAMWDILTMRDTNDEYSKVAYSETFQVDESTTLQSLRTFIVAGPVELCFLVRKGCRKFVKTGRTYFVAHETTVVSSAFGVGVSYDEILCRTVKPGTNRAGGPSAIIETHVLATFPTYKTLSCLPRESLKGFHKSLMRFNHKIEDVLIQKAK